MSLAALTDIRVIAPALDRDNVVALGAVESTVHVYALNPPRALASIATVLSFGGDRLALCTRGDALIIVAAAWERHGVCGYDAKTGAELWQRKDLKRAGPLSPAGDGSLVAVALDRRAMQVLDAATGASVARVTNAQRLWQSRHASLAAVGSYQQLRLLGTQTWTREWSTSIDGFAVLDVGFAVDGLIASDTVDMGEGAAGHVYAFGLDGREQWRHRLPDDVLCWSLGQDATSHEWIGLGHHVNNATSDRLLRWARDGQLLAEIEVAPVAASAFVPNGRWLITERNVVDTRNGAAVPLPSPSLTRDIQQR